MKSKADMRIQALTARDSLNPAYREEQSERIVEQLLQSELYRRANAILSYSSFRSEVGTEELNREILRQGKSLYLPKTYRHEKCIRFYAVEDLSRLKKGYQGIWEPEDASSAEIRYGEKPDADRGDVLMVMPGAAFDVDGYRMGYGGGYYDRYVSRHGEWFTSVFIAFQEQGVPVLPREECDRKPDFILTQEGWFGRQKRII